MPPNSSIIPIRLRSASELETTNQNTLFDKTQTSKANLSPKIRAYLQDLRFDMVDESLDQASLVWLHSVAIAYSSEYLSENSDGIRQDFPRIPLPVKRYDLLASAALGSQIASLLNTRKGVNGVTSGKIPEILRTIGVAAHLEGGQFEDEDFLLTAGWGHTSQSGVTMPGKGKSELRVYSEIETAAIDEEDKMRLGVRTYNIYLNEVAYWRNVPEKVWNYYIGGYQVIKKWLSYREYDLLKRPLTLDEVTEITNMIRRISAILPLEPQLNKNYQKIKANSVDLESLAMQK